MTAPPTALPEAIIVDMDGTLVDVAGIRHYVSDDARYRDFHRFHLASRFCPPHQDVLDRITAERARGRAVFVVTARQDRYEQVSRDWLAKYEADFDAMYMRASSDLRPDSDVKRDILARIRSTHRVVLAIDDNPSVIALWRSEGIPVEVVAGWGDPFVFPEDVPV